MHKNIFVWITLSKKYFVKKFSVKKIHSKKIKCASASRILFFNLFLMETFSLLVRY